MSEKPIILAIDDNQVILTTIVNLLKADYSVIPALGGKVAMRFLEKKSPDLILLDWEMPDMNGIEVLREIKKNPSTRNLSVIFLTATVDPEKEATAFKEGAVDYIQKPIVSDTLRARVRTHLELNGYRKGLEELVYEKTKLMQRREEMTFDLLANLTDFRDKITGGHVKRTTNYVRILVDKIREKNMVAYLVDEETEKNLILSAKLHDIGKIGVSDAILMKEGILTPEEFAEMRMHTVFGAEILDRSFKGLADVDFLKTAREMAYTHQERWDGSGYPEGIKGTAIPFSGRLMAIADVYDALVSKRPYKKRLSHDEAIKIINNGSGIDFDPALVELFNCCLEEFEKYSSSLDETT